MWAICNLRISSKRQRMKFPIVNEKYLFLNQWLSIKSLYYSDSTGYILKRDKAYF